MSAMLSIPEIAKHLRRACDRHGDADEIAWGRKADSDPKRREAAEIALGAALYEMEAWTRLALSRTAVTLEDAAIQLGLTFAELFKIDACELAQQLKSGDLERDIGILLRVVGGIALCVANAAGVDLTDVGEEGLVDRIQAQLPLSVSQ